MVKGVSESYKSLKLLADNIAPILDNISYKMSKTNVEDIHKAIPSIMNKKSEIGVRLNLNLLTDALVGGLASTGAKSLKNSVKWISKADDLVSSGVGNKIINTAKHSDEIPEIPSEAVKGGIKYSSIKPGPLKQGISETFTGASYTQKVLRSDTVFYRVSANEADKVGSYMTRTPQMGGMQSQLDLALKPEWGNTAPVVTKVTVPKGTVIYEGTAAPQVINGGAGMLPGGGNQIYIPEVNPNWF